MQQTILLASSLLKYCVRLYIIFKSGSVTNFIPMKKEVEQKDVGLKLRYAWKELGLFNRERGLKVRENWCLHDRYSCFS